MHDLTSLLLRICLSFQSLTKVDCNSFFLASGDFTARWSIVLSCKKRVNLDLSICQVTDGIRGDHITYCLIIPSKQDVILLELLKHSSSWERHDGGVSQGFFISLSHSILEFLRFLDWSSPKSLKFCQYFCKIHWEVYIDWSVQW